MVTALRDVPPAELSGCFNKKEIALTHAKGKLALAVICTAIGGLFGGLASAQVAPANLDKLKQMKVATADLNIPLVPQTGPNADAIKENLKRVKMPPGFKI